MSLYILDIEALIECFSGSNQLKSWLVSACERGEICLCRSTYSLLREMHPNHFEELKVLAPQVIETTDAHLDVVVSMGDDLLRIDANVLEIIDNLDDSLILISKAYCADLHVITGELSNVDYTVSELCEMLRIECHPISEAA